MALLCNQVQDTFTTTGTGTLTLANAVPASAPAGSTTFNTALTGTGATYPINNVFYYAADASGNFELGVCNLASATSLQRVNVLFSSNAGQLVNWAAGTKNIFCNPNLILSQAGNWQRTLFQSLPENDTVEGTISLQVTQGGTPGTAVNCFYKLDNAGRVTVTIPSAVTSNGVGTVPTVVSIPAFLSNRTNGNIFVPAIVVSNGVNALGAVQIVPGATPTTAGTANIYQTSAGLTTTFTTSVANGLAAQDLSWSLM